ncbi:hypothetical protein Lacidipiscis_00002 [Ligilactobacillus acidipiscis]|uniref:Uncharacterized protein n=1 Tax=Ligilactobacillus acidipiscis TaxID=89059 RepID=A0A1K1KMG6_9LACO|nr:hypothetical protein Lacidipiscis_00002 [Ligilactobacillus acidipiscis]GEN21958.1 hypothetical protein LAC02_52390 [Ligilactobacillus acidipiscis]SFV40072.1 hypothetical protein LAC1533_0652 [Ligilactobacillus acidipiscis]
MSEKFAQGVTILFFLELWNFWNTGIGKLCATKKWAAEIKN